MALYIIIGLIALLAVIALMMVRRGRAQHRLTPLGAVAFALVVGGIVFGDERWLGYGLMGLGILLSIIDIIRRPAVKPPSLNS